MAESLVRLGHDVTVVGPSQNHLFALPFTPGQPFQREIIQGVTYCWMPFPAFANRYGAARFFAWLVFLWKLWHFPWRRLDAPDHILYSSPSLLPGLVMGRLGRLFPRAKRWLDIRDLWPLALQCLAGMRPGHPLYRLLAAAERHILRQSDAVLTVMPQAASYLHPRAARTLPIHWTPHGYDPRLHEPSSRAPDQPPWPKARFMVVYVGSMGQANDVMNLFRAAALLTDEAPALGVHFLWIGAGPQQHALRQKVSTLPHATVWDPLSRSSILPILSRCQLAYDGFPDCDLYQYGFSRNKWVDYAMAGLPILAAYRGAPCLIDRAHCGRITPPGDAHALARAIRELAALPPSERRAMGARGRQYISTHRRYDQMLAPLFPA